MLVNEKAMSESIRKELQKLEKGTATHGLNYDQWLQKLYDRHSERLIQDNERIWRTAAIFIPTALVGFTVLPSAYEKSPLVTLAIGIASCAVVILWNVIADEHRAFQKVHGMWLDEIRRLLGMDEAHDITAKNLATDRLIGFLPSVRSVRLVLTTITIALWCLAMAMAVHLYNAEAPQPVVRGNDTAGTRGVTLGTPTATPATPGREPSGPSGRTR